MVPLHCHGVVQRGKLGVLRVHGLLQVVVQNDATALVHLASQLQARGVSALSGSGGSLNHAQRVLARHPVARTVEPGNEAEETNVHDGELFNDAVVGNREDEQTLGLESAVSQAELFDHELEDDHILAAASESRRNGEEADEVKQEESSPHSDNRSDLLDFLSVPDQNVEASVVAIRFRPENGERERHGDGDIDRRHGGKGRETAVNLTMREREGGHLVVERSDESVGIVDGGVDGALETETDVAEEHFVGGDLTEREEEAGVQRESVHFCSRLDGLRVSVTWGVYGAAVGKRLLGLAIGEEVECGWEVSNVVTEGLEGFFSGEDHLGECLHFVLVLCWNGSEVGEEFLAEEEELVDVAEERVDGVLRGGVVVYGLCVVMYWVRLVID